MPKVAQPAAAGKLLYPCTNHADLLAESALIPLLHALHKDRFRAPPYTDGLRHQKALALVLTPDAIRLTGPAEALVTSQDTKKTPATTYTVQGETCTCADRHPHCKHRQAAELFRTALLWYGAAPQPPPPAETDDPPDHDASWPGGQPPVVPAAPWLAQHPPFTDTLSWMDGEGIQHTACVRANSLTELVTGVQGLKRLIVRARPPEPTTPKTPETAPPAPDEETEKPTKTFAVDKLVGAFDGEREKTYWRVKGVKVLKDYGVTVWPEVLEAAGFPADLAAQVKVLPGWTAVYTLKDGNKPDKVVRLLPPHS